MNTTNPIILPYHQTSGHLRLLQFPLYYINYPYISSLKLKVKYFNL